MGEECVMMGWKWADGVTGRGEGSIARSPDSYCIYWDHGIKKVEDH